MDINWAVFSRLRLYWEHMGTSEHFYRWNARCNFVADDDNESKAPKCVPLFADLAKLGVLVTTSGSETGVQQILRTHKLPGKISGQNRKTSPWCIGDTKMMVLSAGAKMSVLPERKHGKPILTPIKNGCQILLALQWQGWCTMKMRHPTGIQNVFQHWNPMALHWHILPPTLTLLKSITKWALKSIDLNREKGLSVNLTEVAVGRLVVPGCRPPW